MMINGKNNATVVSDPTEQYQTLIQSSYSIFDLNLREVYEYRDLILLLVRKDFIAKYKQTILGPLWAIIQPLLTTIVFTIVFGNLANLTTADSEGIYKIPGFAFYMVGNICWGYFSGTVHDVSNTFLANRNVLGKVYYPRLVTPIATTLSGLISFAIQFVFASAICLYLSIWGNTDIQLTAYILLLPLCVLQMMLLSMGCGIIVSAVTTKYRDLAMLVSFGLQLWQYSSPVAYGLQLIPQNIRFIYMLNPVAPILTTFRYAMFGFGYFNLTEWLISWLTTILVALIGLILYNKIARTFIDTI